ncbi:peptidoglycan DD-metalloendopeptidase family protein [Ekhidna sp.]|uniref:murein hydrolase activator EnvC family protein n=1 Tax=Ekhidna sp. TaxID=2608089 RepID=UPI0032991D2E
MRRSNLHFVAFFFMLAFLSFDTFGQKTKSQLEQEKKENLRKIAEAERILNETADEKKATLGQLQALNQQINARESLIRSIGSEIRILDNEITDLRIVVSSLQGDLKFLKEEYAAQIYSSYKANRGNSRLMFLFSARNFNQLIQRLKYLEQYAKARRLQAEQIEVVTKELNDQRSKVEAKRAEQQRLLNQQVRESRKLANSKKKQSILVAQLTKKERQLRKEVEDRKAANARLNTLIASIIEDEAKKTSTASTAEAASAAELTRLFESKKNSLTWPVGSGFIASKFGKQPHPVLKRITVVNDGVGIQTEKDSQVKAVFDGEVTLIGTIPGKNNVVVIRHGSYLTVYAQLKNINVKKGQKVRANDIIGEVYTDRDGISELEFQVYKGTTKLNPENWLAMK